MFEALQVIPKYPMIMKDLLMKKGVMNFKKINVTHNCIAIISRTILANNEDPGAFTIPCIVEVYELGKI